MKKSTILFTIVSLMIAFTSCKKHVKNFVVTFESNGGSEVVIQNIEEGGKVAKPSPNPTKEDYIFDGWYKDNSFNEEWDFANDVVDRNITLYAKWTNSFTVTFDSNGGSNVKEQTVIKDGKASRPSNPTKSGNVFFDGWYKDNAFKEEWDFATDVVTADITLYAKWTEIPPDKFAVTFDSNGGSNVNAQTVDKGGKATKPTNPTKDRNAFVGWYKDNNTFNNEWNFATDAVNATITLYAKWEVNMFTVTFESNGGSPVTAQDVGKGKTVTKPKDPTIAGTDLFAGWYKDNAFKNVWNFATDVVTADITLYAKWAKTATVTFDSKGGTSVKDTTVAINSKIEPKKPTQVGHVFVGWFTDDGTFQNEWDFATQVVTSDITLYADWLVIGGLKLIYTVTDLNAVRKHLSGQYKLMNDISLAGYNWEPIGGDDPPFRGEFDGDGHKITGLTINRPSAEYVGLFGRIENSIIKNLGVVIAAGGINGGMYAGGIAGYMDNNNKITNCYSTGGAITATNSAGDAYAGGIAGFLKNDNTITGCYSTGNITSSSSDVYSCSGGIAGNINNSTITNCYSTGNITATNTKTSAYSGGIAGYIGGTITNCYSAGDVKAAANGTSSITYAGGIVGRIIGEIKNCAAVNLTISCTGTYTWAGRIAGGGTASNNFALDDMQALDNAFNTDPMFNGVDKTDTELKTQSTYSDAINGDGLGGLGWDFSSTWKMPASSGYPILFWQ